MTTSEKILSRQQLDAANSTAFAEYWNNSFPTDAPRPSAAQFDLWARLHRGNITALLDGIDKTLARYLQLNGKMDLDYLTRYCSGCANRQKSLMLLGKAA